MTNLKNSIEHVQQRIERACSRAGRRKEDVRLLAVTKTVSAERIREAYECGLREFGENRVQEAASKRAALADLDAVWHLIGHLQANKVRAAHELFTWFHAVDSLRIAQRLDRAADGANRLPVLIEVNLGGEESKFGVHPDQAAELASEIARLRTLELRGLMVIPPFYEEPEAARPYFRRLRELAEKIDRQKISGISMSDLSMGMSHDFEIAIEEGATIVRVGTAIFGERQK